MPRPAADGDTSDDAEENCGEEVIPQPAKASTARPVCALSLSMSPREESQQEAPPPLPEKTHQQEHNISSDASPPRGLGSPTSAAQALSMLSSCSMAWLEGNNRKDPRLVMLNVYDLTRMRWIEVLNYLAMPLGVGGVYHVAIEVWGREWNYGSTPHGSGVASVGPGQDPGHRFRGSLPLGLTQRSKKEVQQICEELGKQWHGSSYHCVKHNCCNFAQELAQRLGVGPLPDWVDRVSRTAAGMFGPIDEVLTSMRALKSEWEPVVPAMNMGMKHLEQCCGKGMVIATPQVG